MVTVFRTATEWRKLYPGYKALVLMGPAGASFILLAKDKAPKGKFRFLGFL